MSEDTKPTDEAEATEQQPETEANTDETSLEEQLAAAKEEAAKHWDTALRTQAELENVRRRASKDVEAAHKFAIEKFARELLDIADSMELGLKATEEESATVESLKEGMNLTQQQFYSTLEKLNIDPIDADGVKFDPELHEAMAMVPNPDLEPNTVMEVIQKGYTLNDRLLRPSRVIVSKAET